MGNQSRRRQIIVNPELQRRIIFATAWIPCVGFAITTSLLGYYCVRVHNEALESDAELPSLIPLFVVSLLFTLSAGIYTVWNARRLSNRIAGPIHNMGRVLARYRGGDSSARVQLRQGDFLMDTQDDINELLEWFAEQAADAADRSAATVDTKLETEATVSN